MKSRNSSLECLRIMAIILIFWMHMCGSCEDNEFSRWLTIGINVIGNIGVSCFILISGYFEIRFSVRKLLKLECMLIFYSWLTLFTRFLLTGFGGGLEEIFRYIFPVIGRRYWYFTCYFALTLLSPFLNEFMVKTDRKTLRKCILTMLFVFSAITTFFFFDITLDGGKGIVNMVMLYMIGRYIRLYKNEILPKKKIFLLFMITITINITLNCALYLFTGTIQNRFARDNSLFTILQAVCVFMIFKDWHFESRIVNRFAMHVPAFFAMAGFLWPVVTRYIFDYSVYNTEYYYEFLLLLVALLFFLLGCIIDRLREWLFHKGEEKMISWVCCVGEKIAWLKLIMD